MTYSTPITRAAVSIHRSSRLPPRENIDGVGVPHQCSRADSRLLRGLYTATYQTCEACRIITLDLTITAACTRYRVLPI